MTTIACKLRERLERGEIALGLAVRQARTVDIAKAAKRCGYDWLFLDLEHSTTPLDVIAQIAVAALDAGITPIVRVPAGEYSLASRALDGGALGVVVPHVETVDDACKAVDHLKFPPLGHRSFIGVMPQLDFRPTKPAELASVLNAATFVVAMIETPGALEHVDAIAAVPGVDGLLIGTGDLAMELGIPGEPSHPKMVAAYEAVIAACRRHGKWPGMGGDVGEDALRRYVGMGMRMIIVGSDLGFFMQAATREAATVRSLEAAPSSIG